ncbi:MAG: tetratricopeptide repeat protein [Candidatus Firestonebacteria bacterium]
MKKEKMEFKKMLKEDELISFTKRVVEYLKKPEGLKKSLNWLFYVVVAIIFIFMYGTYRSNIDSTVYSKLSSEKQKYFNGDINDIMINNLKIITTNYPGSKYIGEVIYYLGNCYYKIGRFDEAVKQYEEAKKKKMIDVLKQSVYVSLACAYEEKKDFSKAISTYEELLKKFPDYYAKDEVLINTARNLKLMGKISEAKEKYKEVVNKFPKSPWIELARENIER